MRRDTRPKWMLRKHATISSRRCSMFIHPPGPLGEWWDEIRAAAADLALEPGDYTDWQTWPANDHHQRGSRDNDIPL